MQSHTSPQTGSKTCHWAASVLLWHNLQPLLSYVIIIAGLLFRLHHTVFAVAYLCTCFLLTQNENYDLTNKCIDFVRLQKWRKTWLTWKKKYHTDYNRVHGSPWFSHFSFIWWSRGRSLLLSHVMASLCSFVRCWLPKAEKQRQINVILKVFIEYCSVCLYLPHMPKDSLYSQTALIVYWCVKPP